MLAYHWFIMRPGWLQRLMEAPAIAATVMFVRQGWGADAMYSMIVVQPYRALSRRLRHEPVDDLAAAVTGTLRTGHHLLSLSQTGRLRTYAAGVVVGTVLLLLAWMWS